MNDGSDEQIFNTFLTNLHPTFSSIEFELNSVTLGFNSIPIKFQ
jgi:hypothetical protein